VVVVAPGRQRAFDDAEWRDVLLVERGVIAPERGALNERAERRAAGS
jgi:hypothetical protein